MKNKDIYVYGLQFGRNNLLKGVTRDEYIEYLQNKGFVFNSKAKLNNAHNIFVSIFGFAFKDDDGSDKYFMDMSAYFNYVEHQELIETRKSANTAAILAILAILISIGASYYSMTQSITINSTQLEKLMTLKSDSSELERKVTNFLENESATNAEQIRILESILNQIKSNKEN